RGNQKKRTPPWSGSGLIYLHRSPPLVLSGAVDGSLSTAESKDPSVQQQPELKDLWTNGPSTPSPTKSRRRLRSGRAGNAAFRSFQAKPAHYAWSARGGDRQPIPRTRALATPCAHALLSAWSTIGGHSERLCTRASAATTPSASTDGRPAETRAANTPWKPQPM